MPKSFDISEILKPDLNPTQDLLLPVDVLPECPEPFPLYVPNFQFSIERAEEVIRQMQPIEPIVKEPEPYKHLSVDANFIKLLDNLKPNTSPYQRPDSTMTEDEQKKWNASRMREYRRKSNEVLEKTKEMLDGVKGQCVVSGARLRNLMANTTVEDDVKLNASQFLRMTEEKLLAIPDMKNMFESEPTLGSNGLKITHGIARQYHRRRKIASESGFEMRSLIYVERVVTLNNELLKRQNKPRRSPAQLMKKIKDAMWKAEAYEYFMDDKRIKKVINELLKIDNEFKQSVGMWLIEQLKTFGTTVTLMSAESQ
ncbi:hypothetical protein GCK72_016475 [Caenorhabditis remanei]|uniref:Uncharacterized protein n=1 Tax=Caenorhabditis remanei TaxID=31234 RepID=A0A6A5G4Q9_CAERE|nr:hypothetical protein GCK72_016475 [Caenorhabditis remanei]KAF1749930.1 hypothetical protein GCK72_016475 [Caenorhabditis remanei]